MSEKNVGHAAVNLIWAKNCYAFPHWHIKKLLFAGLLGVFLFFVRPLINCTDKKALGNHSFICIIERVSSFYFG